MHIFLEHELQVRMMKLKMNDIPGNVMSEARIVDRMRISDNIEMKYGYDANHLHRAFIHFNLQGNPELGQVRQQLMQQEQ
jgi:hypothetical protein